MYAKAHFDKTGSELAEILLSNWDELINKFVKLMWEVSKKVFRYNQNLIKKVLLQSRISI